MNSTKAERMNLPIRELLRRGNCGDVLTFRARWQTVVETVSGHVSQKLRLELAPPVSELLLTSTHRSNNYDRNLHLVRTAHSPLLA